MDALNVNGSKSGTPLVRRALLLLCWSVIHVHVGAQDPQFSQFQAASLYLNPAFTGNTPAMRFGIVNRKQWAGTGPGYDTFIAQFEKHSREISSGLGGYVLRDRAGTTGLAFTQVAFCYAYYARVTRKAMLRLGVRGAYAIRDYDRSRMVFADQIERDHAPASLEGALLRRVTYPDAAAGVLFYTTGFWAGVSMAHLNRPQHALLMGEEVRMPVRTSVNLGSRKPLDGDERHATNFLNLGCQYRSQGKWDQLDVGLTVELDRVALGGWYRGLPGLKAYQPGYPNSDALILLLGYRTESRLKLAYTYDLTVSRLGVGSGGSHELSIFYETLPKRKRPKFRTIACPIF